MSSSLGHFEDFRFSVGRQRHEGMELEIWVEEMEALRTKACLRNTYLTAGGYKMDESRKSPSMLVLEGSTIVRKKVVAAPTASSASPCTPRRSLCTTPGPLHGDRIGAFDGAQRISCLPPLLRRAAIRRRGRSRTGGRVGCTLE
eukprot:766550-Hanusia_phi.AAC.2